MRSGIMPKSVRQGVIDWLLQYYCELDRIPEIVDVDKLAIREYEVFHNIEHDDVQDLLDIGSIRLEELITKQREVKNER